jgi:hypothetical protein
MNIFNKPCKHRSKGVFAAVALLFGLLLTQAAANADELPAFRHGLWAFHRTMGGRGVEMRKCIDPSENILQKSGCKLSSINKSENTFTFTADCPAETSPSLELGGHLTVTLKVMSDSFYQIVAEGMMNGQAVKEYLDARRVGDCAK